MKARYANPDALVSSERLAARLGGDNLAVLDATFHLPNVKRDARAEYERGHIPGAMFFDIDAIADPHTTLPHMLPQAEAFARAIGALGIGNDTEVVIYDTHGLASAPRAWWMLRVFGHAHVAVLDGGLPKWKREGRAIDDRPVSPSPRVFRPRFHPELLRGKAQMLTNLVTRAEQVLDTRPAGRFTGIEPEPRAGLRGGHIPGSRSLPFATVIDPQTLRVLPQDALGKLFSDAGIDLSRPVVTSCGSGVTACVVALGLHLLGAEHVAVYDGSWAEWGLPGDTPVEAG